MATILNIHPFDDGNGRTARLIFNAIRSDRRKGTWVPVYLPLKKIFCACSGGFELRLRELETSANWKPLISFFHTIQKMEHDAIESIAQGVRHASN